MAWAERTCFEVRFAGVRDRLKGECSSVHVDGGALKITGDTNGMIDHIFAPGYWLQCDVWKEPV